MVNSGKIIDRIIVQAGLARFAQKSAGFRQALLDRDPEQVLYKGICRALGYAWNVKPFEMLADNVTVQMIRNHATESLRAKYDLLMGAAGLADGRVSRIPEGIQPMKASDWAIIATRPLNHPALRIAGLCRLLQRYEEAGLVPGLVGQVNNALPREATALLDRAFTAEGADSRVLIGTGRAREIAVNAALPFLRAYGASTDNSNLKENAMRIYSSYPSLSQNELTRYMGGLLGNQANGACRQQGLLHIYHTWCRTRECGACPIAMLRNTAPV